MAAPTPESHPKEWAVFCQIDEDNSGTLDTEELYAYLADMEEDIANELMQELDANGDGVVDFAEFVVGWNNVFSIEETDDAAPAEGTEGTEAAAEEAEDQAQADEELREKMKEDKAAAAIQGQWRTKRAGSAGAGGDLTRNGDGSPKSAAEIEEYSQEYNQLARDEAADDAAVVGAIEAARQRQLEAQRQLNAFHREQAAERRLAQEAELEREAMQREDAYMRRMKGGLKQRGMLGHSSGRPLPEDDEPEMASVGDPILLMPKQELAAALTLQIKPLTMPAPELSTQDAIKWGGNAGIRLVLNHNLKRVSFKGVRRRTALTDVM